MSELADKHLKVHQRYRPDCACFNDSDSMLMRVAMSTEIARVMQEIFARACDEMEMCSRARPYVLDAVIISLIIDIAVRGTIIQCGSTDAEREAMRVLLGMEQRIREKMQEIYAGARIEIAAGNLPSMDGRGDKV